MNNLLRGLFLFVACLSAMPVFSATLPGLSDFIDEMVLKHDFKREELTGLFARVEHRPEIIDAISRPSERKPWPEYRAAFVNAYRIKHGLAFWKAHRHDLIRAEKKYGVPQAIIVALIGVETLYGKQTGRFLTLNALTTLAFDYPRRAVFFREELENYLLLAREQQFDLLEVRSSYAGAMGIPQFMPSSYRHYAVDFNGNHKIDLLNETSDAIGSVGNYLHGYGWIRGGRVSVRAQVSGESDPGANKAPRSLEEWAAAGVIPGKKIRRDAQARLLDYTVEEGREFWLGFNNFEVITRYNNSDYYAMSVFQLAEALKAARKGRQRG